MIQATGQGRVSREFIVQFSAKLLSCKAATWWFSMKQANNAPHIWFDFENAVKQEFIPADHERPVMAQLKTCKQIMTAASYISEFRRLALALPDLSEREKWDKFVEGLSDRLRVEACRDPCVNFDKATWLDLRVDLVLNGQKWVSSERSTETKPTPMEIGNVERHTGGYGRKFIKEEEEDFKAGHCFICKKEGCKACNCRRDRRKPYFPATWGSRPANFNAVQVEKDNSDSDTSEN